MAVRLPPYKDLLWPTLQVLKELDRSARTDEVTTAVIKRGQFAEEQLSLRRRPGHPTSSLEDRLAWARNYLKNIGAIENPARGVWAITDAGRTMTEPEVHERVKQWKAEWARARKDQQRRGGKVDDNEPDEGRTPRVVLSDARNALTRDNWKDRLRERLVAMRLVFIVLAALVVLAGVFTAGDLILRDRTERKVVESEIQCADTDEQGEVDGRGHCERLFDKEVRDLCAEGADAAKVTVVFQSTVSKATEYGRRTYTEDC
jgi:Mrr N-terminal domain